MTYQQIINELNCNKLNFKIIPNRFLISFENYRANLYNGDTIIINKKLYKELYKSNCLTLTLHSIFESNRKLYIIGESLTLIDIQAK